MFVKPKMIKKSISFLFAIAIVLSFNLMISFSAEALGNSPLTGLVTLKAMAKEAVPYDNAIANNKPTLLEFYADWCSTCQGMSPTVKDLADKYGDRVNLVMLNIDDPQWDNLVQEYKVTGIPQYTFIRN